MKLDARIATAAALAWALAPFASVSAANKLSVESKTLPLGSTGNTVSVLADVDQDVYGFSIHLTFDSTRVKVTSVEPGSALAALGPEYFEGLLTQSPGRIVQGVVIDISNPITKKLAPGASLELLKLKVDVTASAPGTTLLDLVNQRENPTRLNVLSDGNGDSVAPAPTLTDGTLTLVDFTPVIQAFDSNGGFAGQVFSIAGDHFDQVGLAVTVCGKPASIELLGDHRTIRATAPDCAPGPAEVKVCTTFGCDADPAGFTYQVSVQPPVIDSITGNTGLAGDPFVVTGQHFDASGLAVTVCSAPAPFTLLPDGVTLEVTAPACGAVGWAALRVSTDDGAASEANGFFYEAPVETPFVRGDVNHDADVDLSDAVSILLHLFGGLTPAAPCADALDANDSGKVDLSDAVYILVYLFQGGPVLAEPYPAAGIDPTADSLPGC